ncbi:putative hydroxymethylpyrimidine transporter CytX [Chitinasiproducens palmae]|uniref:Nucleobase:cation symporter-1, NCS1 family n=1 Tax=Chitinasiproducens palmae TaxID=1770053 RepID=A0A1H2PPS5_9BURK|nr:putative hydroxymethylpyrimidine transporter CytX [Chitinasiproducens palmae]SDV47955.1 nucleobase:cation symporter-1, NCS1 family [Chitinasiproducens palmae]
MSDTPQRSSYSPAAPVPPSERVFSGRDAFALWFSLGIGLLVLQAGALLVPALSLPQACAAIVVGSAIGVLLLALVATIGADTGTAAMASLAPALGRRGATLPACLNVVQLFGWAAFEIIVMRDSANALTSQAFGVSHPLLWTVIFGALATWLAIAGPLSFVRRFLRSWGLWLLLAAALWLSWNLFAHEDVAALWHRAGTGGLAFGASLDLVIAMPLSWLPLIADYSRFGRSPRGMFIGTAAGYGIANCWFYLLGAAYGLAAGGGDMLTRSLALAGGGFALLLILIDETDNAFADIHSAAVSGGVLLPSARTPVLALAFGAAATLAALTVPMARYENFLLLIGSVFAPLFGVVLTDHFVLRRRRAPQANGGWRGLPYLAWALGIAAYHAIARWLPDAGATLPALAIAALAHWLMQRGAQRRFAQHRA